MTAFILVHGSWHGGWCWHKVAARLRAMGHSVATPDLPGHGRHPAVARDITLAHYVDAIGCAIAEMDEPVTLVAHSRGGIAAAAASEKMPAAITKAIYLAAYLVRNGERAVDWALQDADSLVMRHLDINRDEGWDMLRASAFRPALYADCTDDDVTLCESLLVPEPSAPTFTPLELTSANFGRIPRAYIRLTQDRAVSPALQDKMLEATPCGEVRSIDASHSAYFSRPGELAAMLSDLARAG